MRPKMQPNSKSEEQIKKYACPYKGCSKRFAQLAHLKVHYITCIFDVTVPIPYAPLDSRADSHGRKAICKRLHLVSTSLQI
jgi:uncharacterized Zn-finger protein